MNALNSDGSLRDHPFLTVILSALLGVACLTDSSSGQVPDVPGWDLAWNDEFDGTSLNTSNWTALDRRDSFNNELQYYHPDQVAVSGGNLELTAIDVPRQGKAYQSGLVTSNDLFGPGRFEARIDLPTTQGMWPAFWLNANHVPWPQGGEIDILENRGSQPHLTSSAYHWQTNPGPCCGDHQFVYDEYTATEGGQPVNFHNSFHTYTAEWDETSIKYYVDGNLHFTVNEGPDRPIFETPKNIILNLAVGGFFGGNPDGTTDFPQTMLVDYVRYWTPEGSTPDPMPEPGDNLLVNPGFDNAGGSTTGWGTFGNTISNVSANSDLTYDGTHALKIFGQFNGPGNVSGAYQSVSIDGGESLRAEASAITPSWDTLLGKSNEVTMKIEFYSAFGAAPGSSDFLGEVSQLIHDGSTAEDIWFDHALDAVAPQDAVEARLMFEFQQASADNGAIWIDSASLFIDSLTGDYNDDGIVDAADYTVWRDTLGQSGASLAADGDNNGVVDQLDYDLWSAAFGQQSTSNSASAAVPEPSCVLLIGASVICVSRRR